MAEGILLTHGRTVISPMTREEYDCAALQSLSSVEFRVYMEMRQRYNGKNNGKIYLSCREAGEVCHMSKSTGWRALNKLKKLGFIRMVKKSAVTNSGGRLAPEYELTAISMSPCLPNQVKLGRCSFLDWEWVDDGNGKRTLQRRSIRATSRFMGDTNVILLQEFRKN